MSKQDDDQIPELILDTVNPKDIETLQKASQVQSLELDLSEPSKLSDEALAENFSKQFVHPYEDKAPKLIGELMQEVSKQSYLAACKAKEDEVSYLYSDLIGQEHRLGCRIELLEMQLSKQSVGLESVCDLMDSIVEVLESQTSDMSEISQYTNEIYDARDMLRKFKK